MENTPSVENAAQAESNITEDVYKSLEELQEPGQADQHAAAAENAQPEKQEQNKQEQNKQETEGDKPEEQGEGEEKPQGDKPQKADEQKNAAELDAQWQKIDQEYANADNGEYVKSFIGYAKSELKMTPKQAKDLADWHINAVMRERQRICDKSRQDLLNEWGANADKNNLAASQAVSILDRRSAGKFQQLINRYGLGADADFMRVMYQCSQLLEEDSLGENKGENRQKEETAFEGLASEYKKYGAVF